MNAKRPWFQREILKTENTCARQRVETTLTCTHGEALETIPQFNASAWWLDRNKTRPPMRVGQYIQQTRRSLLEHAEDGVTLERRGSQRLKSLQMRSSQHCLRTLLWPETGAPSRPRVASSSSSISKTSTSSH
eukprot:CAMPEP_0194527056 /NCGR_PEP_ID=MMETSP0253-20130528/63042_1 /TAXON_ID=2966 /ORGANISM="Noctiluca scintillans" /LENGTH=132 /DNA_ID=CAMNT_0039371939 /DNA_START=35 /DNA_END=434 /DNA_ORIENTATION=-